MKSWKKYLALLLALVLALAMTACGSGTVDDGDDGNDVPDDGGSNSSFSGGQILSDEDFETDVSVWQGDDGGQLLLDLPGGGDLLPDLCQLRFQGGQLAAFVEAAAV